MNNADPTQVLYHLQRTIDNQERLLREMQVNINKIMIELAVLKQTGTLPLTDEDMQRAQSVQSQNRLKDTATGGGIGGAIATAIIILYQWFKNQFG